MVKIKRKVELEPKAFLKHVLEKEETEVELGGYGFDGSNYLFGPEVTVNEDVSYNPNKNTYTVEVEEEITEETEIPRLVGICHFENGVIGSNVTPNVSIKDVLYDNERLGLTTRAFYMLNDDYTMTLLWKDGEMVG